MTTLIKPFRGLRPLPARAAAVVAPPYDVLSTEEARARAEDKPHSFLHISKPEIDLPPGCDPYSPAVYETGADNLQRLIDGGVLIRDEEPFYYVYRLKMGDHVQTGFVAASSVAAYDTNRIRKHEFTRPDKEDDRVRQIDALNAQTGPVLLFYRAAPTLQAILEKAASGTPTYNVTTDGVVHTLWPISDAASIDQITKLVDAMPALYIADGHHRSAAASRVAASRRGKVTDTDSHEYFLTVMFPHDQMRIFDYNRVIADLNGLTAEAFLAKIAASFTVTPAAGQVKPDRPTRFGMYLGNRWYQLDIKPGLIPANDPVAQLDVSLLQAHLIAPILGITDPRRDKRIDFVGGIRGLGELEKRVNSGDMAVAFALHPTRLDQLMAVADAGEVMPPKSTWFEPKLADGFVSHVLD
ncbi:MAG: DUF1015 domain-containing protein [Rhodospirillaceae bacterium]|nr:MAG: DUF1015 domain-containing protein [Rhodospirillaceae bacterium]